MHGDFSPFDDDEFEQQSKSTMQRTALAGAAGYLAGGLAALGAGWVAYGSLALGDPWTLAAAIVVGLVAGTVVGNVTALVLGAWAMASVFGGDDA
jgi:hypothetical protein